MILEDFLQAEAEGARLCTKSRGADSCGGGVWGSPAPFGPTSRVVRWRRLPSWRWQGGKRASQKLGLKKSSREGRHGSPALYEQGGTQVVSMEAAVRPVHRANRRRGRAVAYCGSGHVARTELVEAGDRHQWSRGGRSITPRIARGIDPLRLEPAIESDRILRGGRVVDLLRECSARS